MTQAQAQLMIEQSEKGILEDEHKAFFFGHMVADLRKKFETITNPQDWRAPISCHAFSEKELDLTVAAIKYFTATTPRITKTYAVGYPHPAALCTMMIPAYIVESEGYRNGPAGC